MRRLLLLMAALAVPVAAAQDDPRRAAEAALAEGRYADALTAAERSVAAAPDDAEAHYLLGRVWYAAANPSRDVRRASDAIGRALDLQPDNVLYLVAALEIDRRDTPTFFGDMRLLRRRADLARRLLAVDSTNAFAHEELGAIAIRDFYQYRNAIALPLLRFDDSDRSVAEPRQVEVNVYGQQEGDESGGLPTEVFQDVEVVELRDPEALFGEAGAVGTTDRLDLDRMRAAGVGVVTYEARSRRAYAVAIGHLRRALANDPRRRSVYDHVMRLALLSGDYADALAAAREMLAQFDADPWSWLYMGLVSHRTGDAESAEAAFEQGLARMSDAERDAFTDLSLILPPADVPAFQSDRDAFSRRYWTARDPRFLNVANERRNEHFARLVSADLLYRSERLALRGWSTQRGQLFVRYGPPRAEVTIDGGYQHVLEAFHGRPGTPLRGDGTQGTRFDERDANRFNVWDYGDFRLVFEDPGRNGEFRLYSPPADLYAVAAAGQVARMDYVMVAREQVRREPERYAYEASGRAVGLPYRVAAFRGDDGQTDLYLSYGVPLAVPDSMAPVEDVDVTIRTGAFLIGPGQELVFERRRTIYGLRAAQIVDFDGARLWTSVEPMRARPGAHEVSLEFETAGGGTSAVQRRALEVPAFDGAALAVSDLLLAYAADPTEGRTPPGRIVRNGIALTPAPWGVFGVADPIFLYVEVYGLTVDGGRTDYELEARLVPRDGRRGVARALGRLLGGRPRGVGTTAEAQGDAATDWQSVTLDARGQAPGLYTLSVTVRDRHTGAEASRETTLLLEP